MKRVLFVDDEPKVLGGLRRMLRGLRREWDMEFVESGPEALDRLAASPFDVVVTDMRMPGMDGAQLLGEVMEQHPATVRIILSGQCQRESVLKCVGPAHQFLTKPCDPDTLKSTVGRACRLRDHVPDEHVRRMASCVQSTPSRHSLYADVSRELESPAASTQRIGEIISRDVGMTAKVLQLVSSSFFGTPQRISDVPHAVNLLGPDTIRALFLTTDAFFPFDLENSQEHFFEAQADHSLAVAMAAREIAEAETEDPKLVGDAYLSGLLHDIGTLVLVKESPERYLETLALARHERISLKNAEKRTYNATRDDVGAYLMGLWGLPDPIVKVIAYHLSPARSADQTFGPLAAVHVANAVLEEDVAGMLGMPSPIDGSFLERIGCANRLETWREICRAVTPEGVPQ